MLASHRSGNPALIAHTAAIVVIADYCFTTTAVILQPITGVLLAWQMGWPLTQGWLLGSIILYFFTGLFWLPVIQIQMQLRDLAAEAAANSQPLPDLYHRLFKRWVSLGIPAFITVLIILWLMVARPRLGFI